MPREGMGGNGSGLRGRRQSRWLRTADGFAVCSSTNFAALVGPVHIDLDQRYFSEEFFQFSPDIVCKSRLLSRAFQVQTMTKREDLRKEFLAIAELRLMKVEEIRELLSISPAASVEEVLRIMKCWQDSGDGSTPAELRSQAHRLLSEIHCLNGATLEILDKLRPVAPATASILSYKYERMQ
jgi:hypothetical protein